MSNEVFTTYDLTAFTMLHSENRDLELFKNDVKKVFPGKYHTDKRVYTIKDLLYFCKPYIKRQIKQRDIRFWLNQYYGYKETLKLLFNNPEYDNLYE